MKLNNQSLNKYNIYNPLFTKETVDKVKKMTDDIYTEAQHPDVVKFEKVGDNIEGKFVDYEESKQYPNSYAVRIETAEGFKAVFVSGILVDKLKANSIEKGQQIKIEFLGKKKTQDEKREYNDYKLFFVEKA